MPNVDLSDRQKAILRLIVQEYIRSATPVSSKMITHDYSLGVSSATVRNEMAILEELGYVLQPHTSAGRVPTDAGYRYFVENLMVWDMLPFNEQCMISHQFHQARLELDQWLQLSASILAHTSHNAALITVPKGGCCLLKHLEIIAVQDTIALLILVLQGGIVKQQILTLEQPTPQAELSMLARQLTAEWLGLTAHGVTNCPKQFMPLGQVVQQVVGEAMERIDARYSSDVYRDGLLNLLNQPEFKDERNNLHQIIRALEEHWVIEQLVSATLQGGGIQIIIGGEDKWNELSQISIVLASYGVNDKVSGVMGVLGPTRMPYERTVSVVRYMSQLMSDLIGNLYG